MSKKTWEMGSEFMENSSREGKNEYAMLLNFPKRYVLSGRTGLHLIADEIKEKYGVSSILMPAYCCSSMVEPFVKYGFEIFFYDSMNLSESNILQKADVVLIMDYFGFLSESTVSFADRCKRLGKTVIVDATQTVLSHSDTYSAADYVVASFRKWFDCLCAVVYSRDGFITPKYQREKEDYILKWRTAAKEKGNYIIHGIGEKKRILADFSDANRMLGEDFIGYRGCASEISKWENLESAFIKQIRRRNAQLLIDEIKEISKQYEVTLLFNQMGNEDCPLFIPILIDDKKRDKVRVEMIRENIYCPVHWPINKNYPYQQTLYHAKELSLICDQRYSEEEIEHEIEVLRKAISG